MLNSYRKYTTSQDGVNLGYALDNMFKTSAKALALDCNFKKHSLNPYSFTETNLISKPDFISKHLVIECKYSQHNCLYGVNIEQMINHINLFDNENKSIDFLFAIVSKNLKQITYIEAREVCNFYTKGEFLLNQGIDLDGRFKGVKVDLYNKGKSTFSINFISKITKTKQNIGLKNIFLINTNRYYKQGADNV